MTTDVFGDGRAVIHQGDSLEVLRTLPSESVQCCITSPPYWGLRSYGVDGQYGLEKSPAAYVEKMVEVFREVRRILRSDGCCFINLGDSYCGGGRGNGYGGKQDTNRGTINMADSIIPPGLKPKDLCEIPSDVVRALRADGWWLRSRIPWLKRNAMPESTTDRPCTAVEYVFLLTKSARYFYDGEAVKVLGAGVSGGACFGKQDDGAADAKAQSRTYERPTYASRSRRNADWFFESWQGLYEEGEGPLAFVVNPTVFKQAHFATFPVGLVLPCIKAGTSEKGCCPTCGASWDRIVVRRAPEFDGSKYGQRAVDASGGALDGGTARSTLGSPNGKLVGQYETASWRPGCECNIEDLLSQGDRLAHGLCIPRDPVPCTVLDPFAGASTTGVAALQLGRRFVGIELNAEYVKMSVERMRKAAAPATYRSDAPGEAGLFEEKP